MGLTPDFLVELRNKGFDVIAMGHAYRVNGVVDLFFSGKTVYDKVENEYFNLNSQQESKAKCITLATNYGKREAFKKTKIRNNISYQEFKHKESKPVAEFYHWDNDTTMSDDHLYFIRSGINVKIGRSQDPNKRLKELATGIAEIPKLLLTVHNRGHMERVLHRCFKKWRIRKNAEWFLLCDQITDFIEHIENEQKKFLRAGRKFREPINSR